MGPFLFLSNTSTRSWILKHLFAKIHQGNLLLSCRPCNSHTAINTISTFFFIYIYIKNKHLTKCWLILLVDARLLTSHWQTVNLNLHWLSAKFLKVSNNSNSHFRFKSDLTILTLVIFLRDLRQILSLVFIKFKGPFQNDVNAKMPNFRPPLPYVTISHIFHYTPSPHVTM